MAKPQTNYAFIDGNNLHLIMVNLGWALDYKRFRVYLSEHYGVAKAYYFIGYVPEMSALYISLQSYGFVLVHKPVLKLKDGKVKGNIQNSGHRGCGVVRFSVHLGPSHGKLDTVGSAGEMR